MSPSELRSSAVVSYIYSLSLKERAKAANRTLDEQELASEGSDAALTLSLAYAVAAQNTERDFFSRPEPCPEPAPLRDESGDDANLRQVAAKGPPLRLGASGWLLVGWTVLCAGLFAWRVLQ